MMTRLPSPVVESCRFLGGALVLMGILCAFWLMKKGVSLTVLLYGVTMVLLMVAAIK
jgi:hypothetical protein